MTETTMRKLMKTCFVAAVLCCSMTPASADPDKNESGKPDKRDRWKGEEHKAEGERNRGQRRSSYFHDHGYARLDIPKGHYPPPGECRIWFPDRPAGHQPPPGSCGRLRGQVPPGAWLIRHPKDEPQHVHVNVYDVHRPGTVEVVGVFQIDTGSFLRELRPR